MNPESKSLQYLYLDGNEKVFFSLPSGWIPAGSIKVEKEDSSATVEEMARKALQESVGLSFRNVKLNNKRITIIVDDGTRPTPVKEILLVLLENLKQQNASEDHISIIIAVGSHASMSKDALTIKLGADVVSRFKVIQHNAIQADLVSLDVPDAGMTVKVNPVVINADIKIGISSILPHNFAGFGGGPKILMPGVCDRDSMIKHHMLNAIQPRSKAGMAEGNPFHESCMKIASAIGLDLSIDCVYNQHGKLIDIVSGSLKTAFYKAADICRQRLGYSLEEKVDITISSTYPHTHGIQFCKGLGTPIAITKNTGAIILAAPIKSALPDEFVNAVAETRTKYGDHVSDHITRIMSEGKLVFGDKSPEFNMAFFDLLGRPKVRTLLVAPMISPDIAAKLGFESVPSVEDGIKKLEKNYPKAKVTVLPAGGLIIPVGGVCNNIN
jgi:lactate racemase